MTPWTLASLALAVPSASEPAPEGAEQAPATTESSRRKLRLPPTRLGVSAGARSSTFASVVLDAGVQPWRSKRVSLETYFNVHGDELFQLPGLARRDMVTVSLFAEPLVHLSPMVALGPSLGVGVRSYRQDWWPEANVVVPQLGGTAQACMMRTRTWGLALTVRALVEPVPTEIVLHTQQVVPVPAFQGQLGMRLLLGHGRVQGVRQ